MKKKTRNRRCRKHYTRRVNRLRGFRKRYSRVKNTKHKKRRQRKTKRRGGGVRGAFNKGLNKPQEGGESDEERAAVAAEAAAIAADLSSVLGEEHNRKQSAILDDAERLAAYESGWFVPLEGVE